MHTDTPLPDVIIRLDEAAQPHAIFAVNVDSESTGFDVVSRVSDAFKGGVKSVWVVFPNVKQVHVFTSPTQVRVLVPPMN